jgi:hypothetical protein
LIKPEKLLPSAVKNAGYFFQEFVTEASSLLCLRTSFGYCQKTEKDAAFTGTLYLQYSVRLAGLLLASARA